MVADKDEFDAEYGALPESDEFDAELADLTGAEPDKPQPQPAAAPVKKPDPSGLDYLMALADGASLGLGRGVERMIHSPAREAHTDAQFAGSSGVLSEVPDTAGTKATRMAGALATSVPLAIGAGPSVGGQALLGAAQGGAGAWGQGESVLGGMAAGGALGALGGAVAKGSAALRAPAGGAMPEMVSNAGQAPMSVAQKALLELGEKQPSLAGMFMSPYAGAKNLVGQGAIKAMGSAATAPLAQQLGQAGARAAGSNLGDEVGALAGGASKAFAQDNGWNVEIGDAEPYQNGVRAVIGEPVIQQPWQVQTGDAQIRDAGPAATQSWAVESVLYQGNSGLPRDADQQRLDFNETATPEKLATATFLLSGKYPKFSDALQKQRASLIREEE